VVKLTRPTNLKQWTFHKIVRRFPQNDDIFPWTFFPNEIPADRRLCARTCLRAG